MWGEEIVFLFSKRRQLRAVGGSGETSSGAQHSALFIACHLEGEGWAVKDIQALCRCCLAVCRCLQQARFEHLVNACCQAPVWKVVPAQERAVAGLQSVFE